MRFLLVESETTFEFEAPIEFVEDVLWAVRRAAESSYDVRRQRLSNVEVDVSDSAVPVELSFEMDHPTISFASCTVDAQLVRVVRRGEKWIAEYRLESQLYRRDGSL